MICGAILVLNLTVFSWDEQLPKVINTAIKTCSITKRGCVKKVTRTEERVFHVVCEKKQPEE